MSSPADATQSMIRNLEEKTGRSLVEWVEHARQSGFARHGEIVRHLKADHGFTHGYANLVAIRALEPEAAGEADDLVSAQYSGAKANLRPLYDALIEKVAGFGADVEVAPKKAYVSLRRRRQFAIIQTGTASRLDVGLNLKGSDPTERLEPSGSFNSMVSHRVRVSSLDQIDEELLGWLRSAYEAA
jgi:predicted transport protein